MNSGRVLILEDDEGVGVLERNTLRRAGYHVDWVRSSAEAQEIVATTGSNLIVLDYTLSGGPNGVEFYKSLTAQGYHIPAILVTGLSDENRLIEAMRAGIRDFVPKRPDFIDHLSASVERVMRQLDVEDKLVRAEEERRTAEAHNRIKDEFLAVLSHELRTPMTSILGWTRILKAGNVEAQVMSKALQVIERNARAQIDLINDLLDVSRIITGKLELNLESQDFVALVASCADAIRPSIENKGIVLQLDLRDGPIPVTCDPVRIQQVFNNLLSNALKFTPAGGTIRIETRLSGNQAEATISDTGIGIEKDFLPYIFDRFRQEDSSITRKHQGLGIGLAIVHHLIHLHHGEITAKSEGRDTGSTFILTIPRAS
jgi:signal transduction histidine kinase